MESDRAKAFHHAGLVARFRPYHSVGHLAGRNPLDAAWLTNDATT